MIIKRKSQSIFIFLKLSTNSLKLVLAKTIKATKRLSERVEYGIKSDAVSLTRVRGIGRKRARILVDHGIRDLTQLLTLNSKDLIKIPGFGKELADTVIKEAKTMLNSEKDNEPVLNGLNGLFH